MGETVSDAVESNDVHLAGHHCSREARVVEVIVLVASEITADDGAKIAANSASGAKGRSIMPSPHRVSAHVSAHI